MAETPRLDLPYIAASQYQKEVVHNVSLDRLDLLVQCAVLDRNLATPPGSPALGDAYIVAAGATGAWATHDQHLALWVSSQWQFIAPLPGFQCWVIDEAVQVYWNGTAWTIVSAGGGGATTFLALTDTPNAYTGQAGKTLLVNVGETALEFGTSAGAAPVDASYIVGASHAGLSAERVLTDNTTITWDLATAGQVKALIAPDAVTFAQMQPVNEGILLGRSSAAPGDIEQITPGSGLTLSGGILNIAGGAVTSFLALTDTPDAYSGQAGKAVLVNAGATALEFGTAGAGTFLALSDTPDNYVGQGGKVVAVKTDGSGLEFLTGGGGSGSPTTGAVVTRSTSQSITASTGTAIIFTAETLDQEAYWDNANPTRLTVPRTGWYSVTFTVEWQASAAGLRDVTIRVNGTDYRFIVRENQQGSGATVPQATSGIVYLTAGQYVEGTVYQNTAGDLSVTTASLSIMWAGSGSTGATDWLSLTDTPDSYVGQAGKVVQVNAGATATEFGPVLGTMATQHADAVAITGGSASGLTQVGIGTTPSYPLDVTGQVRVTGNLGLQADPVSDRAITLVQRRDLLSHGITIISYGNDSSGYALQFYNTSGAVVGTVLCSSAATAYNTSSDVRLKRNVQPLTDSLDVIAQLNPISHLWNADDSYGEGFLAHELQRVLAYAVSGEPDAVGSNGEVLPQQVDVSKCVPRLVGAVKELLAQVEALTARVAQLEEALGL